MISSHDSFAGKKKYNNHLNSKNNNIDDLNNQELKNFTEELIAENSQLRTKNKFNLNSDSQLIPSLEKKIAQYENELDNRRRWKDSKGILNIPDDPNKYNLNQNADMDLEKNHKKVRFNNIRVIIKNSFLRTTNSNIRKMRKT